ncbi:MAG: DCL family protein [Paracoccaceae bacterium]|nr:DCL family protein [Paracoccaceae bacterium]
MLEVAGVGFESVSHLRDYVYKQVLAKSRLDLPLYGKALRVIETLFSYHPQLTEKTGVGIKHFCVGKHASGARAYCVVRIDGTQESFSLKKCISGFQQATPISANNRERNRTPKKETAAAKPTSPQKGPTVRKQIIALLSEGQRKRRDIIRNIYGVSATASQSKYVGKQLSSLVTKGQIVRVKTGVYERGTGLIFPTDPIAKTELQSRILNTLACGEKRRSEVITEVLGQTPHRNHIQSLQNMLKHLCDTGQIIKMRHGVYGTIDKDIEDKEIDLQERIRQLTAYLAHCQQELQKIQAEIENRLPTG